MGNPFKVGPDIPVLDDSSLEDKAQMKADLAMHKARLDVLGKRLSVIEDNPEVLESVETIVREDLYKHTNDLRHVHDDIKEVCRSQGAIAICEKILNIKAELKDEAEDLNRIINDLTESLA